MPIFQHIHAKNIVYRDVKPDNFLLDPKSEKIIHVIDFGLAKFYRAEKTMEHIPYKDNVSPTGTPRYMSVNVHLGCEASRRDDLEAIGNVLIYLLRGSLPWQGIKADTAWQKMAKICKKKQEHSIEDLCKGSDSVSMMSKYFGYIRSLRFEATPDYSYLQGIFSATIENLGEVAESRFDWNGTVCAGPGASCSALTISQ